MIEQWQDLLEHGVDLSGYELAIKHYSQLRDKMIEQFKDRVFALNLPKEYMNVQQLFEKEIFENASDFGEGFVNAKNTLLKLEEAVAEIIANEDTTATKQLLEEIRKKTYDNKKKIKDQQQYLKRQLNFQQDVIFKSLGKDNSFIQNMLSVGNSSGDISDLVNQASSYFIRYLYSSLFNDKTILQSNFKYLMSMGGYYKELAEYEGLEKILNQYLKVTHAGSIKTSSGKDSEIDIIISAFSDMTKAAEMLEQNTEITEYIESLPAETDAVELSQKLLKDINWFGEQVKSSSLGKSDTFKIGHRSNLFNNFNGEVNNPYSSLQAIQFLARFKNILLSLGQNNVLFSQNRKRQWMADFIADFRAQNYALSFARKSDNEKLTSVVELEQLYTKKTQQLKRRFRS